MAAKNNFFAEAFSISFDLSVIREDTVCIEMDYSRRYAGEGIVVQTMTAKLKDELIPNGAIGSRLNAFSLEPKSTIRWKIEPIGKTENFVRNATMIINQSRLCVITPYKESYNSPRLDVVQPLLTPRQDNFHSTYDLTTLMLT